MTAKTLGIERQLVKQIHLDFSLDLGADSLG